MLYFYTDDHFHVDLTMLSIISYLLGIARTITLFNYLMLGVGIVVAMVVVEEYALVATDVAEATSSVQSDRQFD